MRILLDAMSGDNAPGEILLGASMACLELDADITICGNKEAILLAAKEKSIDISRLSIAHAEQVVTMEDNPLCVVREKKDSSMSVGLGMLSRKEGDAFVSAGNTGALLAGSTLIVRKIKGIASAAIASILPFPVPVLLIDSGANPEVGSDKLLQFAIMGSVYMKKLFGMDRPRVGLLNNGTEHNKGTKTAKEGYIILSAEKNINFIGNVEACSIPFGVCDVLVTDGFTGNIVLKLLEGMGTFMGNTIKDIFTTNALSKLSSLAVKGKIAKIKRSMNPSEYGGAPLLGISAPVIKAHGASDAYAIKNALLQAINFVSTGVIPDITKETQNCRSNAVGDNEKTAGKTESENQ